MWSWWRMGARPLRCARWQELGWRAWCCCLAEHCSTHALGPSRRHCREEGSGELEGPWTGRSPGEWKENLPKGRVLVTASPCWFFPQLGFNIRGGKASQLGIFISKVCPSIPVPFPPGSCLCQWEQLSRPAVQGGLCLPHTP